MSFAIVADSTLDMRDELRKNVNFVPLKIIIGNSVFKDGEKGIEEVFKMAREKKTYAKTSQPSPEEFKKMYEDLLKKYDFIVSLHISEKLSGTIQSAKIASEEFKNRIFIFDTMAASIIGDPYVEKLIQMKDEKPDVIMKELEYMRRRISFYLTVGCFEYLEKSGRISGLEAVIGSMLKLRPIIEVTDGALHIKRITRGEKGPIKFFKKRMEKMGEKIVIGSILAKDKVEELEKHAKELMKDFVSIEVKSCALAVHLGPGSYGVVYID